MKISRNSQGVSGLVFGLKQGLGRRVQCRDTVTDRIGFKHVDGSYSRSQHVVGP